MTTKNPFPGMNPFFEQRWQDAHTMLIAYMRDALQERLPSDLVAGAEEELVAIGGEADPVKFRAPEASEPRRVFVDDEIERWIEIHDLTGRLVTVVELLSPSNKEDEPARGRYCNKRRTFLSAEVNVVEIDLVRRGWSVFPDKVRELMRKQGAPYAVCVFRASHLGERELYTIDLRDRLPVISIPLRPTDADIPLELQPLIDHCHERGRYHLLRYRSELEPPLSPSDTTWVQEILRQHQLV